MTSCVPELWEHQQRNSGQLLDLLYHRMAGADCSETGTGKTVTALETVMDFNLPFVVVCPKSVKCHWKNWMEDFPVTRYEKYLRKGTTVHFQTLPKTENPLPKSEAGGSESFPRCLGVFGWEETSSANTRLFTQSSDGSAGHDQAPEAFSDL